jgi:hypothetical protein
MRLIHTRRYAAIAALLALSAHALVAQPRALRVEANRPLAYDTRIAVTSTQTIMGQEIGMSLDATGTADLMPQKTSKKGIEWSVGFSRLTLRAESPMLSSGTYDTTVKVAPEPLLTDLAGRVTSSPGLQAGNAQISLLLGQALGANWWSQFFSPTLVRGAKVGESWELRSGDTARSPQVGLEMRRSVTTRHTFEALVDTLGRRAMRVRTSIPSLELNGSMSAQGMPMSLSGDGAAEGTFYYDAETGLLIAGALDSELNLNAALTGGAKMVVPITLATSYSIMRRD